MGAMPDERVFHVIAGAATPASPIDLAQAGFLERSDMQEWVLAHPEILGEQVLILTSEFDKWELSTGARQLNRLDVLGIDADGRLVLAELKRDRAPDTVQLQAINYAALVAKLEASDLVEIYREYQHARGRVLTGEDAEQEILDHCGELDPEILSSPRIVLVAGEFSAVTTTAVDWLAAQGIDVSLQRVQAYRIPDGQTIPTVSQLYPLAVVDDLLVSPRRTGFKQKQQQLRGRHETSTVIRLVRDQTLGDGTLLTLVPTNQVSPDVRERVIAWIEEDPSRGRATWRNDRAAPLVWEADGQAYKPTTIVKKALLSATGVERASIAGPRWWRNAEMKSLADLAGANSTAGFDWAPLHAALKEVRAGRWTSYGDLAALVGTKAMPLGQHLATCDACTNAWRVLDGEGRSRPNFAWSDESRTDSQQHALEQEGVMFSADGRADAALRLTAEELAELSEQLEDE